jgi:hypothetical protein
MDDLDPTVAEQILGEYPELLEQWRETVRQCRADLPAREYELKRAHLAYYLQLVVRQHRWLTEGPGDCPDPKLAQRCEEVVADYPPVRDERAAMLVDPWWRASASTDGGWLLAELYDPDYLERYVRARREGADPFSKSNIEYQEFSDALKTASEVTVTDLRTGESWVEQREPVRPESGAPYN